MSSIPRIVVVDPMYEAARIMRGALTLLTRPHILIEAPSAESALAEVQGSEVDLVVTTFALSDDMTGIDLATRISHMSLSTAVIVLGSENDPRLAADELEKATFQYFMRPVGEAFLRGLRIALDGEPAVEQETQVAAPGIDLGPVPSVNIDELRAHVSPLMRDVGAMGILLADRNGRILVDEGATGYVNREELAALMGPFFARSAEVGPLVGGKAWSMMYYDGDRLDVFGLALGLHYFMCLIFEGNNRGAFGAVNHFGRRAVDQMIEMLGDAAYRIKQPEPLPAPKPPKKPKTAPLQKMTPPVAEVPAAPPSQDVADLEALFDTTPSAPILDPVQDFDPDALFGQAIDESMADSMFDPDALSDLAQSLATEGDERVGYDEAFDMGILDDLG